MSLFQPALLEAPLRSPDGFAYQPDLLSVSAAEDLLRRLPALDFKPFEFRSYLASGG